MLTRALLERRLHKVAINLQLFAGRRSTSGLDRQWAAEVLGILATLPPADAGWQAEENSQTRRQKNLRRFGSSDAPEICSHTSGATQTNGVAGTTQASGDVVIATLAASGREGEAVSRSSPGGRGIQIS